MPEPIKTNDIDDNASILGGGSLADDLDTNDKSVEGIKPTEAAKPEYVSKIDYDELKKTLTGLQDILKETGQELQFMRGRQAAVQQQQAPTEKIEAPAKFEPNYDTVTKDIEDRGTVALREFADKLIDHRLSEFRKELTKESDQRFAQRDAGQRRAAMFKNELDQCSSEFAYQWADDTFKVDADREAANILSLRTGIPIDQLLSDPRSVSWYQPGDLYAAASRTYSKWMKMGKIKSNEDSVSRLRIIPYERSLGASPGLTTPAMAIAAPVIPILKPSMSYLTKNPTDGRPVMCSLSSHLTA
jgi:hypothetical protein